jgi:sugar/nucleoside kinase (ribokinase family)
MDMKEAKAAAMEAAKAKGQKMTPADDAEFLRRVWLDFDGGVPTADEARAFFADKAADKRSRLVVFR